jgi:hypothetical protein
MGVQTIQAKGYNWRKGYFRETLNLPTDLDEIPEDDGAIRYNPLTRDVEKWDGLILGWVPINGIGLEDGDKYDIEVTGDVWRIKDLAITDDKVNDVRFLKITDLPSTIDGYGILDAVSISGAQTISNKSISGLTNFFSFIPVSALAQGGAAVGEVLKWNGTQWAPGVDEDSGGGGGISDGNKGDITVSSAGASWVINGNAITTSKINAGAVTDAKIADVAWSKITGTPTTVSGYGITDAVTLTGSQVITNKTMSGANNTFTNISLGSLVQGGATTGQVIKWNGTAWAPGDDDDTGEGTTYSFSGGLTETGGTVTIATNGVTSIKINALAITDSKVNDVAWSKITGTPTTISGYGITDGVTLTGVQILSNKTLTTPKINLGSDATGDTYYRDASGNLVRVPIGSSGQVWKVVSGVPAWAADSTGGGGGSLADGDYGEISVTASGSLISIDNGVVTNAKLSNVSTGTFKGRSTAGSGGVEDMTATEATALLNTFSSSLKGLVPASGGGTTNFLRADGTWAAPAGGGSSYTFTASDFNESGSTVSIDYANGQAATTSQKGFLTAADWNIFNGKQNAIVTGSTAQYFRGDLSLATFPTALSSFTNDSGYLTNITGKINAGTNVNITGAGTTASPYVINATAAGTVTGVSGTTNRITSTGGAIPVIDISSSYAGQSSIITLGTITTGVWNGSAISDTYISSATTWNNKQDLLVSGTNIKTINGVSLLGSGNITISGGSFTDPEGVLNAIDEGFIEGADNTAIMEAYSLTGKKLFFPAGEYFYDRAAISSHSNWEIFGEEGTIFRTTTDQVVVWITGNSSSWKLHDILFENTVSDSSEGTEGLIFIANFGDSGNNISNWQIWNVGVTAPNRKTNGIKLIAEDESGFMDNWSIYNVRGYSLGRMGIEVQNHVGDGVQRFRNYSIRSSKLQNIGTVHSGVSVSAISVSGPGIGGIIDDVDIIDVHTASGWNVVNYGIENAGTENLQVTNNRFRSENYGFTGFLNSSSVTTSRKMIFAHNTLNLFGGSDVNKVRGWELSNLQDSSFHSNVVFVDGYGGLLDNVSDCSFTGNTMRSKTYQVLYIQNGSTRNIITANDLDNVGSSVGNSGTIYLTGATTTGNYIYNNKLRSPDGFGQVVEAGSASNNTRFPLTENPFNFYSPASNSTVAVFGNASNGQIRFDGAGNQISGYASGSLSDLIFNSTGITFSGLTGAVDEMLVINASGELSRQAIPSGSGGISSVSGTINRITSTGGATPIIDISSSYVGQSSITTLGTITTGVWNGTAIANNKGGLPTGGSAGWMLYKSSGTDFASSWGPAPTLSIGAGDGILIDGENNISIDDDYIISLVGSGVTDGNKTDIIISGSGTVYTIANNAVTSSKILDANVTNAKLQNSTIGFGTPGTSGTVPNWSSSTTALGASGTLNIPLASASGVTAGLVSKTNYDAWQAKQEALVSGTNIKTLNGASVLGSGNISIVGLTDTNYGDWTISSTGTVATINNNAVTTAKILDANVTNAKIATGVDAVKLGDGTVTNTELQYINSLTSNAQTQIDRKPRVFNVLDYGAIGDNSTNNDVAFAACMAAVIANGGGVFYIPKGVFIGQIIIPQISGTNWMSLEIVGESMPPPIWGTYGSFTLLHNTTIIKSNATSGAVIAAAMGVSGLSYFNTVHAVVRNLEIRTYDNPQIDGLDLHYAQQCRVENVVINTGVYSNDATEPTHGTAGLRTPKFNNGALTYLRNITISGYADAYIINEHTNADGINAAGCINGLVFPENGHGTYIGRACLQNIRYPVNVSGVCRFRIAELNLEHLNPGYPGTYWQETLYDIYDPSNLAAADVVYSVNLGYVGIEHTFTKNGGATIYCTEIGTSIGGGSSQWTDVTGGIYYSGDKVGIGNSTPASILDVLSANPSGDAVQFRNTQAGGYMNLVARNDLNNGLSFVSWGSTLSATRFGESTTGAGGIIWDRDVNPTKPFVIGTYSADKLVLGTSNTARISIAANGLITLPDFAGFGTGVIGVDNTGTLSWVSGGGGGGSSQWTTTGSDIYYNTGKVGIGNSAPASILDVLSTNSSGDAVNFKNNQAGGYMNLLIRNDLNSGLSIVAWGSTLSATRFGESTTGAAGIIWDRSTNPSDPLLIGTYSADKLVLGTDNTARISIAAAGTITLPGLAGNGTGVIAVDNSGNLSFSAGGGGGGESLDQTLTIGNSTAQTINFTLSGGTNQNLGLGTYNLAANVAATRFYPSAGTNVGGALAVMPKGTGYSSSIKSQIAVYNTDFIADGTNYEFGTLRAAGADGYGLFSYKGGTGTVRPIWVDATGAADATTANMTFNVNGSTTLGSGSNSLILPTTRPGTNGYVPSWNTDGSFAAWVAASGGGGSGTVTSVAASGGSTGLSFSGSPVTTTGTLTLAGTLAAASGGTGQTTYSVGDILYASASTTLSKLSAGTYGYVLTSNGPGNAPSYQALPGVGQDAAFVTLSVTTSDATPTYMSGNMPLGNGENGILEITVYGVDSANATNFTHKIAVPYKKVSGVTYFFGTPNDIIPEQSFGGGLDAASFSHSFDGSGNVVIQVTGIAATGIQWRAEIKKYSVYWSA